MNAKEMLFLKSVVGAAQASQHETGVPASITIAQSILESGWGNTSLAREGNNYFGIKATANATPDEYLELPTAEFINGQKVLVEAEFAKYPTVADGFIAHGKLLSAAPRYAPAMAVKDSPEAFAAALRSCGYSTNPNYAGLLMQLVNEFDLTQYDIVTA